MGLDEDLSKIEEGFETDSELAEEEINFEDEEEYEDDELGSDAMESDLEGVYQDFEDFDYEVEQDAEKNNEKSEEEKEEYSTGITKEDVSETTDNFNAIFKEGAAATKELKEAIDDIKSAFDFKNFFKK